MRTCVIFKVLLLMMILLSSPTSAQDGRQYINYFYVKGKVCLPVTVKHSRGQFTIYENGERHDGALSYVEDYERPYMYVWDYYRFDLIDGDIQIRHKVHTKRVYLSNEEQTTYTTIKNIKVNCDTIRCDKYFPPEGNTRIKNSIPYETCVEHYECRFTIVGTILYVEEGPLIREFYSKGKIVDIYKRDESYRYEFYNEKDNW